MGLLLLLREKIIVLVEAYTSLFEGVTAMHARIFLFKRFLHPSQSL